MVVMFDPDHVDLEEIGLLTTEQFDSISEEEQDAYVKAVMTNQWWRLNNLYKIQNEESETVTFKPRPEQKSLLLGWWCEIILKARQIGFSTAIQIYGLDMSLWNSDFKCGLVAHREEDARELFRTKVRFSYDNLPTWLRNRIPTVLNNERILTFTNGSSISWSSSYRSKSLSMLHVSEAGKISLSEDKANELKAGTFPAVTAEGARIFIESTAEGASGLFYEQFNAAAELCQSLGVEDDHYSTLDLLTRKQYHARFVPWFSDPKYAEKPRGKFFIPKHMEMYFEAVEEAAGVTLSTAQKYWYMGKAKQLGEMVKQEYPSTPQEAFLTSGRRVFNPIDVMRAEGRCEKPIIVFDINPDTGKMVKVTGKVDREGKSDTMTKGLMGYLLVWELPEEDAQYACGADVAEGLEHGDRSSFDILDSNGNQVAHWYGHLDTVKFARLLAHVCEFYNFAYVGPERNNHGHAVINELRNVYPVRYIYTEEVHDRDTEHEETQRIGWLTTKKSKPIIVDHLKEAFSNDDDGIRWLGTIKECNTYVYDEKGSSNAMDGCFDDQVMSYAIANEMVARMPRFKTKSQVEEEARRFDEWRKDRPRLGGLPI